MLDNEEEGISREQLSTIKKRFLLFSSGATGNRRPQMAVAVMWMVI